MRPLTIDELIDYIGTHQRGTIDGEVIAALKQVQSANARAEAAERRVELLDHNLTKADEFTKTLKGQYLSTNAQIEQLQEQLRWRKLKDERPKHEGPWLVTSGNSSFVAFYDSESVDDFCWNAKGNRWNGRIWTYWRPLPPTDGGLDHE